SRATVILTVIRKLQVRLRAGGVESSTASSRTPPCCVYPAGCLSGLNGQVVVAACQSSNYFFQIPRGSSNKEFNLGGHCSSPANSLIETLGCIPLISCCGCPFQTTSSNMLDMLEWKGDRVRAGGQKREHSSKILSSIPASTFYSYCGMESVFCPRPRLQSSLQAPGRLIIWTTLESMNRQLYLRIYTPPQHVVRSRFVCAAQLGPLYCQLQAVVHPVPSPTISSSAICVSSTMFPSPR
ncbi:hypothetical protein B0H16DRAFT_1846031, partial [Mycena metata]